ncbi:hypothetical protein MC7420_425 [Coleofasciculus chthonoplastes PCC 7420]|uniref:Uncharacterized protein n=1 Tax=Coleofasciculus chthonoplastes PCC 7420 TaxID=118168 RepID=B4VLY6_9CYAN|nr:hypothetical protein MC7420_425 [Coleofasciculus chthonoplastes PCC 7420]
MSEVETQQSNPLVVLLLKPLSHASPHPQPLSQAWERGAREEQEHPIPLLPCNKSEASAVLPPLVGGNEGGGEGVRG